ncbi:hypothetical protein ACHAXA_006811 [Cyclostephanos tholiformis]|uniref:Casein kinase II subunit beta n=1 Tax=Cyclostephanos tholiformis TaxID=382380 RepID=A0ABD3RRL1_9STRA
MGGTGGRVVGMGMGMGAVQGGGGGMAGSYEGGGTDRGMTGDRGGMKNISLGGDRERGGMGEGATNQSFHRHYGHHPNERGGGVTMTGVNGVANGTANAAGMIDPVVDPLSRDDNPIISGYRVATGGGEKLASDDDDDEDDDEDDDDDEEEEDSSEISPSDEDGSWIAWFCNLRGNEYFVEVDEDYIQDDFNLTGLNGLVPYYDYALDMVLDVEMPMEESLTEEQHEIVESAAEMLYGMIHARYIVTNRGMHAMYEKYRSAAFGRCPQVFCHGQPVLPVGLSDMPRNYTVNVFCPRCRGLFFPKSTRQANIDGAYFGTTFPHLYLMTHPEMIPARPSQQYIPRVYGFRINQASLYFRNNEDDQLNNNGQNDNRISSSSSRRVNRSRQGGGGTRR